MVANRIPGIRAGLCHDTYSAHQGVEHDDMNVLVLGGRVIGIELARELIREPRRAESHARAVRDRAAAGRRDRHFAGKRPTFLILISFEGPDRYSVAGDSACEGHLIQWFGRPGAEAEVSAYFTPGEWWRLGGEGIVREIVQVYVNFVRAIDGGSRPARRLDRGALPAWTRRSRG